MAEQMAAQKLESEQAKTEAARAEMGAELEAAYAGLESLRIELETARGRLEALEQAQAEAQALRVDVAAARAEAAAYKLTIDGFELKKAAKNSAGEKRVEQDGSGFSECSGFDDDPIGSTVDHRQITGNSGPA